MDSPPWVFMDSDGAAYELKGYAPLSDVQRPRILYGNGGDFWKLMTFCPGLKTRCPQKSRIILST
uniref:Uncharacterized protein n=1 Tax=Lutzomyia longipalpis TaxID=7200 RepID=A0A1B0GKR4_LUTLO